MCVSNCDKQEAIPVRISTKNMLLWQAFNSTVDAYGHTIWAYVEAECNGHKTYTISTRED